jgi:hypothetical protein
LVEKRIKPSWVVVGGVAGAIFSDKILGGTVKGALVGGLASWVLAKVK